MKKKLPTKKCLFLLSWEGTGGHGKPLGYHSSLTGTFRSAGTHWGSPTCLQCPLGPFLLLRICSTPGSRRSLSSQGDISSSGTAGTGLRAAFPARKNPLLALSPILNTQRTSLSSLCSAGAQDSPRQVGTEGRAPRSSPKWLFRNQGVKRLRPPSQDTSHPLWSKSLEPGRLHHDALGRHHPRQQMLQIPLLQESKPRQTRNKLRFPLPGQQIPATSP